MERFAVVGRLRFGAEREARRLVEEGPPFDLADARCEAHDIYLGREHVVFVFEGLSSSRLMAMMARDLEATATLGAWARLLDGTPQLLERTFAWRAEGVESQA